MDITNTKNKEDFLKVDYTSVNQLRKDSGVLHWTLAPSTSKLKE